MKLLLIVSLVATFGAYIYWRARPYIKLARHALKAFREAESLMTARSANPPAQPAKATLVQCSACHTWVPRPPAITRRDYAKAFYCSIACRERETDDQTTRVNSRR